MCNKKAVIWSVVGCMAFAFVLWLVMSVHSAVDRAFQIEKESTAYQVFFFAVDQYSQENGRLPESFEELLTVESVIHDWVTIWEVTPSYLQELIEPDFTVPPNADNLGMFAPSYKSKAFWADYDCEWLWESIVENCEPDE